MGLFSFFPRRTKSAPLSRRRARPHVETLEDRTVPTTLAPKTVQFTNAVANFATSGQDTNFNLSGVVDQFDPNLGQLQSVTITHQGSITSTIQIENLSRSQGDNISSTVGGKLTIAAPGVNNILNISQNVPSVPAAIFDGVIDFDGASGSTFTPAAASNSQTINVPASNFASWIGNGKVTFTEQATATSSASGGGNLATHITSVGWAQITVTYTYVVSQVSGYVYHDIDDDGLKDPGEEGIGGVTIALSGTNSLGAPIAGRTVVTDASGYYLFDGLAPGNYTVTELPPQPALYPLDGKDTAGSLGGSSAINDVISGIALPGDSSSINNNFGELKPASLSGYVYFDANDNGIKEAGETPIPGTVITLNGFAGGFVSLNATTDPSGFYHFDNLRPGTYALLEGTPPVAHIDGKDTIGSQGGDTANDNFSNIKLLSGVAGINNNFGEKVAETADIGIVKTANLPQVRIGDTLIYRLLVTNYGTFTAREVTVTDTLPAGALYVSASGVGWTITPPVGGVLTAKLPSLAVHASSTIFVTIKVRAVANTLFNETDVTAKTPDNNPLNNHSEVTTPVIIPPPAIRSMATHVLRAGGIFSKRDLMSYTTFVGGRRIIANAADATFVDGLYQTLLGRPIDVPTQNALVTQMAMGRTRASVVAGIINSDAFRGAQADSLYVSVFGRKPNAFERQSAIATLRTGSTTEQLAQQLYTSSEYQTRNPTGELLVGNLYLSIVGKLPSLADSSATVQAMDNTPLSDLVTSLQSMDDAGRNEVNTIYRQVLRRNATENEIATWAPQLQSGAATATNLTQALVTSAEFYNLAFRLRVN